MALAAVTYGLPFPAWPTAVSGAPALANQYTLDASGEKAAHIFVASAAKAIRKVHLLTSTVTTGDTMDVRVETVDSAANGDPTGTLVGVNANASLVIAGSDDNVWKVATLTADTPTLAIGDVIALVLVNGAAGNMLIRGYNRQTAGMPYGDLFASAAWAKNLTVPMMVPEYFDGSFAPIYGYADSGGPINTNIFNSGSTTNRRGNRFQLAFPARVKACWVWADIDGPFTVILYDSDGTTPLATTATINQFQRQANLGGIHFFPFTTTATLARNTTYRVAIVPTSATSLTAYDFDVPAAGMLDLFAGGQACHRSVFTSGAWVETTTSRSYLGVFLDAFDDAVSAGTQVAYPFVG